MTSIEWLENELLNRGVRIYQNSLHRELFNQAKEMHKQEIMDAYLQCGKDNFEHIKVINRSAEEHYQEKFGLKRIR